MSRSYRLLPWLLVLLAPGAAAQPKMGPAARTAHLTDGWPDRAREVAAQVTAKYGIPDEATATALSWRDRGAWKRIVVHRDAVRHDFPSPHLDVLEQVIDYAVPADKVDELARFDGSLVVMRTRGELASTCDREALNVLAINLAQDVIKGTKDVDAARQEMARSATAALRGEGPPYTQRLMLDANRAAAADADVEIKPAAQPAAQPAPQPAPQPAAQPPVGEEPPTVAPPPDRKPLEGEPIDDI
jgi:hypothetical protein